MHAINGEKKKILLVDDDPIALNYEACVLERVGYDVLKAYNGNEALETFKSCPVDLLVTDISMPGRDGIQLIHDIKNAVIEIPIIVVTGKSQQYSDFLKNEFGIYEVIHKPISHNVLLSVVGIFLRNYAPERTAVFLESPEERLQELSLHLERGRFD